MYTIEKKDNVYYVLKDGDYVLTPAKNKLRTIYHTLANAIVDKLNNSNIFSPTSIIDYHYYRIDQVSQESQDVLINDLVSLIKNDWTFKCPTAEPNAQMKWMSYFGTYMSQCERITAWIKSLSLIQLSAVCIYSRLMGSINIPFTLANWTGVAYKIPRTELEKCKELDILKQSGVYFLFGTSDDTGESVVYIGQAGVRKNGEGILYRLQEHKRNPDKDYWTEAVVFTTSNNSFGPTEISYLENRFVKLSLEAKRYAVKNGNDPTPGNITEEKESELEEFIDYAKIVMGTLGHRIFEKLISAPAPTIGSTLPVSEPSVFFELKQGKIYAKGQRTSDGFVVLKESLIRTQVAPSCPKHAKKARDQYASAITSDGMLSVDILLRSPAEAACFVTGTSINAREAWKTAEGKTLKEIENKEGEI